MQKCATGSTKAPQFLGELFLWDDAHVQRIAQLKRIMQPILERAEQRDQKSAELGQYLGADPEELDLAKAVWLTGRGNHYG